MKHDLPPLDSLKAFEAAARLLSFSAAAEELCVTKAAISYQVAKLEEALDCRLFRRSVRQVYLTDAGQALWQTTQKVFSQLRHTIDEIQPGAAGHDVVIGVTTYVALRWLSPLIGQFTARHPDVAILLQHAVNSEHFRLHDVDIAIRWGEMTGKTGRSRLAEMPMPLFPACSPALLEKQEVDTGRPLPDDALAKPPLNSIPLLCEERELDLWQAWYAENQTPLPNPRRTIADANVRTQAAIDGQGWTLADGLMRTELKSGALVAPFGHRLEGYGYALLVAPGRPLGRKAVALRDWLVGVAV